MAGRPVGMIPAHPGLKQVADRGKASRGLAPRSKAPTGSRNPGIFCGVPSFALSALAAHRWHQQDPMQSTSIRSQAHLALACHGPARTTQTCLGFVAIIGQLVGYDRATFESALESALIAECPTHYRAGADLHDDLRTGRARGPVDRVGQGRSSAALWQTHFLAGSTAHRID